MVCFNCSPGTASPKLFKSRKKCSISELLFSPLPAHLHPGWVLKWPLVNGGVLSLSQLHSFWESHLET